MINEENVGGGHSEVQTGHVLVVDDNAINRKKISKAVLVLGHSVDVAEDGERALEMMRAENFDAVLLDILMPNMDGFDVLEAMKGDNRLKDTPVIVISALGDETESAVKGIELGAEDFLPKDFDPVVLRARLSSCLSKKFHRDQEKQYYQRVEVLTAAASQVESGRFKPETLGLDEVAKNPDQLGRLATIFRGMAAEIYDREVRAQSTIKRLRGGLWIIAVGIVWGLTPSIGRFVSIFNYDPLGFVFWANMLCGLLLLGRAAIQGKLPRLSWGDAGFFVLWAVIAGVLQRSSAYIASAYVEAALLSLVLTLQGFLVFGFAALLGMEKAAPRRLLGLAVGVFGVGVVMWTKMESTQFGALIWLGVAMLVPLFMAIEVLVMAGRKPDHIDDGAAVGIMMLVSTAILGPYILATGSFIPLTLELTPLHGFVLAGALVTVFAYLIAFHIIKTSGPVFFSQSAYTMTIAGVVWGVLLLNESLSPMAWAAFGIIVVGMYLVEPQTDEAELIIKRDFEDQSS